MSESVLSRSAVNTLVSSTGVPKLLLSENKELQTLLDAMRATIFYLDSWGVVKHCNQRALEWRGRAVLGANFIEFAKGWDDPSERQREIMHVIRSGCSLLDSLECVHEAGHEYWFRVDKIPTMSSDQTVNGVLLVLNDVTESIKTERELRLSEDRYRAFIANSTEGIWCYDILPPIDINQDKDRQIDLVIRRAVLAECNHGFAKIVGVEHTDELLGLPMGQGGSLTNRENIVEFVHNGYRLDEKEFARINRKGERLIMQSSAMGIVENGYLTRAWGTTRDITERRRYLDKLEYLANHDPLTSLPNRSLLFRKVRDAIEQNTSRSRMALMLIDLDRFKEINDTLGHLAGDKVLKQLGPRLEVELGEMPGMVARLGGDEFAIFIPKIRNKQHAVVLAHRFLDAICQMFEIEGFQTEISASIGVAVAPDHANDVTTLMRYADVAMYNAKHRLKGVSLYDAKFDSHTPKRLALMGALGVAIRENQLCLHYQPKICLQTGKVFGYEALIRWNHPTMGFIPPGEFVPIAEMSSFIHAMTSWVLEQTIKQCADWHRQGFELVCAMNLSARNLIDDRIVSDLSRFLQKYDLPGRFLEMEITESTLMSDPERAQTALEKIDALGVSLAIDDFGTGYSSLAYLKRLPVKILELDGSFVQGMETDAQDEIIVNSTIQLAHNLGLELVAEGVETENVYQRLKELGCDSVQGYYISKPLAVEKATEWMKSSSWAFGDT